MNPAERDWKSARGTLMVWRIAMGAGVALLAGLVVHLGWPAATGDEALITQARAALLRGEPAMAREFARGVAKRVPDRPDVLLLLAEASAELGRFDDAIDYCKRVPRGTGADYARSQCLLGEIEMQHFGRPVAAERAFREALEADDESIEAHNRLAYLLTLQARTWDLVPQQLWMLGHGAVTPVRLWSLAVSERLRPDVQVLTQLGAGEPDAPGLLIAHAQLAALAGDLSLAVRHLKQAIAADPSLLDAQARLGRLLLEQSDLEGLSLWQTKLPPGATNHPGIWEVFGLRADLDGDSAGAARCFVEALRRDGALPTASQGLGTALARLGDEEGSRLWLDRAARLREYMLLVDPGHGARGNPRLSATTLTKASALCESLGLRWEAFGWLSLAAADPSSAGEFREEAARMQRRMRDQALVRVAPPDNPALSFDPERWPLPASLRGADWSSERNVPSSVSDAPVRFRDDAQAVGLQFRYFNSADPAVPGLGRAYEFTGGGTAVLDYDLDGWPDLYFTQGCRWPAKPESEEHLDLLSRNMRGVVFEDVTFRAGIREAGYSQGVAVGDFDSDGFPDLRVANLGANRLFRNNGDGSFADQTERCGAAGDRWTTSCLLADLNGDGLPDIYDVNYLARGETETRRCRDATGRPLNCTPRDFDAADDQLWLNLGDGRFTEVSEAAGILQPNGKGLGILACDPNADGLLDVFVANDGEPNFWFENRTTEPGAAPVFQERAVLAGLAVNRDGKTEACMGVAAGDFDSDGRLDLFVTNFLEESNTLYRQESPEFFQDLTPLTGLVAPSLRMLGFGTQAIDGNLDGWLDLIVVNGHLDDFRPQGLPWTMPPQFFMNRGAARFVEADPGELGPYFSGQYLGRSVARLDWNRDGREDLVVSHLDRPAALLTNDSPTEYRSLSIRLRGRTCGRDAIGTRLTLCVGDRTIVRELTAGDGYQASNQRELVIGVGPCDHVGNVVVHWPSGRETQLAELPAGSTATLIEGQDEVILSPYLPE